MNPFVSARLKLFTAIYLCVRCLFLIVNGQLLLSDPFCVLLGSHALLLLHGWLLLTCQSFFFGTSALLQTDVQYLFLFTYVCEHIFGFIFHCIVFILLKLAWACYGMCATQFTHVQSQYKGVLNAHRRLCSTF